MKKLIALLLAVCLICMVSACGAKAPAAETPTEAKQATEPAKEETVAVTEAETNNLPEGPVEIELWTDMSTIESQLTTAIEKFNAAYADKGYSVTLNCFAGSQRSALISAAKETNTLPALFMSAWFTTSDYVHQGMIADITDVAESVKDDMYASAYDATVIDGKSYMVGVYQSYFGFIYNADMMKAAGLEEFVPEDPNAVAAWTVSDMEETILPALAKYMEGTEKYPIGFFAADNQGDTFMMNWLTMLGGKLWDNGHSVAGEDPNTIAALEKMISWTNNGLTNSNVTTKSGSEVGNEFKNQMSAICSGQYTTYTGVLKAIANGDIESFDVRVAAIPVEKDGQNTCTMANYLYGASVMNNGNEDQMAVAKEFIRWMLNDEETMTAVSVTALPCYKSLSDKLEGDYPIYASMDAMSDYIWDFTGGVAGYVTTRSALFPELQAAFSGEKTAADALAAYSAAANEIIAEYEANSLVLN